MHTYCTHGESISPSVMYDVNTLFMPRISVPENCLYIGPTNNFADIVTLVCVHQSKGNAASARDSSVATFDCPYSLYECVLINPVPFFIVVFVVCETLSCMTC